MKMYYVLDNDDGLELRCREGNAGDLGRCFASKAAAFSAYRDSLSAALVEHNQAVADIGRKAEELHELILSERSQG